MIYTNKHTYVLRLSPLYFSTLVLLLRVAEYTNGIFLTSRTAKDKLLRAHSVGAILRDFGGAGFKRTAANAGFIGGSRGGSRGGRGGGRGRNAGRRGWKGGRAGWRVGHKH